MDLNNLTQEELEALTNSINEIKVKNKKETKKGNGFFSFLRRKQKMVEEKQENNVKEEIKVEENNNKVEENIVEEVKKVEEVKEEPVKIEENEVIIEDKNNNFIKVDDIKVTNVSSFNEKSEYKIATFEIKVKNENVGQVLTKLGTYADELNKLEQVEHCDLTIINNK